MTTADLAVDIGGTFVDIVARGPDGQLRIAKLPSSRAAPEAAMEAALDAALAELAIGPAQPRKALVKAHLSLRQCHDRLQMQINPVLAQRIAHRFQRCR